MPASSCIAVVYSGAWRGIVDRLRPAPGSPLPSAVEISSFLGVDGVALGTADFGELGPDQAQMRIDRQSCTWQSHAVKSCGPSGPQDLAFWGREQPLTSAPGESGVCCR